MNQTKSHIPHYIHGTHSSHAKSLKNSKPENHENPTKLSRPKVTKYGLNGRKRSTENEDLKKDQRSSEQSEIDRLKSLVDEQKEKIAILERSSGKENQLRDEIQTLESRFQKTDEKLEKYEKQLLLCNIDPVSLESLDPTEEKQNVLREIGNKTKIDVSKLKAGIDDMNIKTKQVLSDLKAIGAELDSISSEENSVSTVQ